MKVLGTIKSLFPVNAFTVTVFVNSLGKHFVQEEKNAKIKGFTEIELEEDEIIKYKGDITVNKGDDLLHCFTKEDDTLIIGTLDDIRGILLKLLHEPKLNPVAKVIVCDKLMMHGKTSEYVRQSNIYMKKKKVNCQLDRYSYINIEHKENIASKTIIDRLHSCKAKVEQTDFNWKDYFEVLGKNVIFEDCYLKLNKFFNITNRNSESNEFINYIHELILEKIGNLEIEKDTITENDCFYNSLFKHELQQYQVDKILSPGIKALANNEGYQSSVMTKSYFIEEFFTSRESKLNSGLKSSEMKKLLKMAKDIKNKIA